MVEAIGLKISVGADVCSAVGKRPTPGPAEELLLSHSSGAQVRFDKDGNITVSAGPGKDVSVSASGGEISLSAWRRDSHRGEAGKGGDQLMALVLVEGAVLMCSHGGRTRLTGGNHHLTVRGKGALTAGAEAGIAFGSAAQPAPGMVVPCAGVDPSGRPAPCITTAALPPGVSVKLSVGGTPVLMSTARGITVPPGAPPGTWSVADPGQNLLEAI
ncbi:hypothetical protein WKI71_44425 [Streptomyces sp. MS1.AVA.1]|uniref:Uncharacterized protein n=1 Tax=Streptomyces machairae TaxID=3134109 RepID=A0ABU8UXB6_9ACTN